jgi:hypothetical protein
MRKGKFVSAVNAVAKRCEEPPSENAFPFSFATSASFAVKILALVGLNADY